VPHSLPSLWVTVGVTVKDEGKCLYTGFDFRAAQAALDAAGPEFDSVGILPHGMCAVKMRRPAASRSIPAVSGPIAAAQIPPAEIPIKSKKSKT
jgi:hypothetical protein